MGSGPALHLASKFQIKMLILVSAFGSIKNVVKDTLGVLGSMLVKNSFDNIKKIQEVRCRTLIIHGSKDTVVKPKQAELLQDNCSGQCDCLFFKEMTHNKMRTKQWVAEPIGFITEQMNFKFEGKNTVEVPKILFERPPPGFNFKL